MTIAQFTPEWEKKYAWKHLSESTVEAYLNNIENHIKPAIGHIRLDQFKPIHVNDFLDGLERKDGKEGKLAIGTVQYIFRVLSDIFERAVEWKIIKKNPVAGIKKPTNLSGRQPSQTNVYNEAEVSKLFSYVKDKPFHWRIW